VETTAARRRTKKRTWLLMGAVTATLLSLGIGAIAWTMSYLVSEPLGLVIVSLVFGLLLWFYAGKIYELEERIKELERR